jgi:cobalt transporter subunit CbtA
MTIFRNVVFLAAIAGLLAGVVMTALQAFATVPLILQAETYENAEAAGGHDHAAAAPAEEQAAPAAHEHDADGWAPADGAERYTFTALSNIVTGVGFALLLVVASELAGGIRSWRGGMLWGLAGFAVFTLAPGLGLPPELPAMPAADLGDRQIWWTLTVVATAAGLALIAFKGSVVASVAGLALLVAPHILGAPQPVSYETAVPEGLHHQFVVAVTVTNLLFWVVLGGLVGVARRLFVQPGEAGLRDRLA